MSDDKPVDPQQPESSRDKDAVAFAQGIFDLARNGGATLLAPLLEAGVPVDMRTSEGDTLLLLATRHRQPQTVQLLLTNGASPDHCNNQQRTPLMLAAMADDTGLVEQLLAAGADPLRTDADGNTALTLARKSRAEAAARQLAQY